MLDLDAIKKRWCEGWPLPVSYEHALLHARIDGRALIAEVKRLESELEAALADKPADMKG